jgi:hypothetical protein
MLHEMIHLFCRENDLKETCQGGRYHNKFFKVESEKRDLHIEYNRSIGYSLTKPTDAFIAKLREAGYTLEVPFARYTLNIEKPKVYRNKTRRYFCSVCAQEVRSTADLNLICGNCEIPMECAAA